MLVKITQTTAGAGFVWRENEVHELPDDQAKAWIKNGQAEPLMAKRSSKAERRSAATVEER
jgi:hypothetical protein